jgi:hypothetical protein
MSSETKGGHARGRAAGAGAPRLRTAVRDHTAISDGDAAAMPSLAQLCLGTVRRYYVYNPLAGGMLVGK